jgi:peptidoglycan/LPS O-acetylase OafA/YrhL
MLRSWASRSAAPPCGRAQHGDNLVRARDDLLARLSRRTTTGRYLPEVDGLRFVCIALVVLLHVQEMSAIWSGHGHLIAPFGYLRVTSFGGGLVERVIGNGSVGVIVFFAISGFVLALPFAEARRTARRIDLRRYYLRRATRIEPPYVVALALAFVLGPLTAAAGYGQLLPHLISGLVYVHGPVYDAVNRLGAPTWSLEVEMQFYVLVPLLAAIVFSTADRSSRVVRMVIVCLAASTLFTVLLSVANYAFPSVFGAMVFFMAGFAVADRFICGWDQTPARSRRWDVATLVGWPALLLLGSRLQIAEPLVVLLVFVAALRGSGTSRFLSNRWVSTIGGMCYSIYLTHLPLLVLLAPLGRSLVVGGYRATMVLEIVVMVPIVVTVGTVFFVLIERPCMDPTWPTRMAASVRGWIARRRPVLDEAAPS